MKEIKILYNYICNPLLKREAKYEIYEVEKITNEVLELITDKLVLD